MPSLKHVTGSKQLQFLPPLLYFDKFFCPGGFPKTYERAAVGIYLPPRASAFHPGPFPVACTIFTTTYMCCRKDIFLSEKYILVGKIFLSTTYLQASPHSSSTKYLSFVNSATNHSLSSYPSSSCAHNDNQMQLISLSTIFQQPPR